MVLRPRKKTPRPGEFENKPSPIFVSRPKRDRKASIRSEFFFWGEKRVSFLQNDALTAILIVEGRESVFRKARDELCHVVGSEETRNRKNTRKKRRNDSWCLHLCFRPNPETRVGSFHNQVRPVLRVLAENALKAERQILLQICAFFLV